MIGVSTYALFDKSLGVALYKFREFPLDFVEIMDEGYHVLDKYNYKPHLEALESYGLKNIIHAPFSDLNIAALSEKLRRVMLETIFETLEIAHEMGSLLVVLHPGHYSPLSLKFPKAYEKVHKRSLEEIDRVAEKIGVKVALENMPKFPILDGQTADRIYNLIDGTNLYVTFDVGHLYTVTKNYAEFLELLGDRIIHIHLHDNDGKNDSHLALGDGIIPWDDVLEILPKNITWSLEVRSLDDFKKSLEFLKSYLK
ncbi:sugar phosphate isomerase/epimerase [Thermococcus sp. M39]|nr:MULTISPECIES: sugar phosphate isomerase/epimerase [unclassified Thermococcus]NJE08839.1 sugar phosphate isomerase/epimerase [Thermococcus sp. M39]NJE13500.1 sugar phosphate isomerase/epimerase [Thermococcus sp. LS2]